MKTMISKWAKHPVCNTEEKIETVTSHIFHLLLLFFLLLVLIFTPTKSLYAGEIVEKVKSDKVVIVGIVADAPPFSFLMGKDGVPINLVESIESTGPTNLTGFDVEIAQAIIKNLNLNIKPKFVVVNPIELIPLIAEGEIHMAPGLSHKIGWEKAIDFSVTYFVAGTGVAVKKGSSIRKLKHLKRRKIALPSGISADIVLRMIPGVELVPTEDVSSGFELVKERVVVGVAGDIRDLLNYISREEKPGSFIVMEESISKTPCAIGIPPTDARWREMIDFSMMKIFESGEYGEIYEKWFGKDSRTKYSPGFTMELWPK